MGFVLGFIVGLVAFVPLCLLALTLGLSSEYAIQSALYTAKKKKREWQVADKLAHDKAFEQAKTLESKEPHKEGWLRATRSYQAPAHVQETGHLSNIVMQAFKGRHSHKQQQVKREDKDTYWAVLKDATLYLYETDDELNLQHTIALNEQSVSMYPKGLKDSEVFKRVSAILIAPRGEARDAVDEDQKSEEEWYLTVRNHPAKEDWYFALVKAVQFAGHLDTEENEKQARRRIYSTQFTRSAIRQLIETIDADSKHEHTRWFNAIIGRMFLGIYKTDRVKQFLMSKLKNKVEKSRRPSFLSDLIVRDMQIGQSIPYFTLPKLVSFTPDGELLVEANVHYVGGWRMELETEATFNVTFRKKPVKVKLVLEVTLRQLRGPMVLKIKASPSNRIWFGFEKIPDMKFDIVPVVSDKRVTLSVVKHAIEVKIRELVEESMVYPNMTDLPFFNSFGEGGIFGDIVEEERDIEWEKREEVLMEENIKKVKQVSGAEEKEHGTHEQYQDPFAAWEISKIYEDMEGHIKRLDDNEKQREAREQHEPKVDKKEGPKTQPQLADMEEALGTDRNKAHKHPHSPIGESHSQPNLLHHERFDDVSTRSQPDLISSAALAKRPHLVEQSVKSMESDSGVSQGSTESAAVNLEPTVPSSTSLPITRSSDTVSDTSSIKTDVSTYTELGIAPPSHSNTHPQPSSNRHSRDHMWRGMAGQLISKTRDARAGAKAEKEKTKADREREKSERQAALLRESQEMKERLAAKLKAVAGEKKPGTLEEKTAISGAQPSHSDTDLVDLQGAAPSNGPANKELSPLVPPPLPKRKVMGKVVPNLMHIQDDHETAQDVMPSLDPSQNAADMPMTTGDSKSEQTNREADLIDLGDDAIQQMLSDSELTNRTPALSDQISHIDSSTLPKLSPPAKPARRKNTFTSSQEQTSKVES